MGKAKNKRQRVVAGSDITYDPYKIHTTIFDIRHYDISSACTARTNAIEKLTTFLSSGASLFDPAGLLLYHEYNNSVKGWNKSYTDFMSWYQHPNIIMNDDQQWRLGYVVGLVMDVRNLDRQLRPVLREHLKECGKARGSGDLS